MSDPLQQLLDKRALDELIFRTMHARDACDWPAYRASFVEDAAFDFREHGAAPPQARQVIFGIDTIIALQKSVLEGFDTAQHHVTNMVHSIDGDDAVTDCNLYAEHFLNNDCGDRSVSLGGRYQVSSRRHVFGRIAAFRARHLSLTTKHDDRRRRGGASAVSVGRIEGRGHR